MTRLITKNARMAARWIPTHTMAVKRHNIDAVVYVNLPALTAIAYIGTAAKPYFHIRFRTQKEMENRIKQLFDGLQTNNEFKAQQNAARRQAHTLKVGDILSSSWGYEQTNVDFFQVTKVISASTVEIRELAQNRTADEYMSGTCTPIPNAFLERSEPMRKRASADNSVRIETHQSASLWNGQPRRYSSYA